MSQRCHVNNRVAPELVRVLVNDGFGNDIVRLPTQDAIGLAYLLNRLEAARPAGRRVALAPCADVELSLKRVDF